MALHQSPTAQLHWCERCSSPTTTYHPVRDAVACSACGATIIVFIPDDQLVPARAAPTVVQLLAGQQNRRERDVAELITAVIERALETGRIAATALLNQNVVAELRTAFCDVREQRSIDLLVAGQVEQWLGRLTALYARP